MQVKTPLLILKNVVVLPKNIVPVTIGKTSSVHTVEWALEQEGREVIVLLQKEGEAELQGKAAYDIGTRATILQAIKTPKNVFKILLEGIGRVEVVSQELQENTWFGFWKPMTTTCSVSLVDITAAWRHFSTVYQEYLVMYPKMPTGLVSIDPGTHEDAETIIDTVAMQANLRMIDRQRLLETAGLYDRIALLTSCLKTEIEIIKTEEQIKNHVQTQIESTQREYYLHEQLKAIEKELRSDKKDFGLDNYRKQVMQAGLSEEAMERFEREMSRLEQMQPFSAESTVSRTYIEWLLSIPWQQQSRDRLSIGQAEKLLNKQHAGLAKVKERILEFIAARKFAQNTIRTPVICLVGPPGVGKTSLGKSIAESLNREFIRVSLGGVRDEAEIRGHRKTYIGSMPGKIIQGMKRAKTINPVFLLDEIDKMTSDSQGDPAAALLEVLDPEQNKSFMDNYLEIPYDISQVVFIATANTVDSIPYPLFDRMEIVSIAGYTRKEKIEIAKNFLIPKQLAEHALTSKQCLVTQEALELLISEYTREAGVRQLERLLIRTFRKAIQTLLSNKKNNLITITPELIQHYFKAPPYKPKNLEISKNRVGIATGLAWTEMGGDILEIEVAITPGKGNITLTGQLGEIMQESAQAAISYLRTRSKELGIPKNFASNYDVHIHVPEGATPKDGPSAGITMCTALASAITKIPVKSHVAMTGEITLQGRVLAVGGLKEKILAAQMHGITAVLIPADHKELALEALEELGDDMTIKPIFVDMIDDVLLHALIENPFTKIQKLASSKKKSSTTKKRKEIQKSL